MGANTQRVGRVLVSNSASANTGTSVTTIAAEDVILFNRHFDVVGDTDTLQNSVDAAQLYIVLGGAGGVIADQDGIQTRHIRNVRVSNYVAPVAYAATVAVGTPTNSTNYIFKIIFRDEYPTTTGHSAPRSYSYTSDSSATAVEIAQGIADAINADKASNQYVVASVDGAGNFTVTAKPQPVDIIGGYERVTFDVACPAGFVGSTIAYTPGTSGTGVGAKFKELERDTNNYIQRRLFPIPADQTRALATGKYNVVTIEHYHQHLADFSRPALEPRKTLVAFPAVIDGQGVVTAGAKQAAFIVKLTSVVESAGVFVS